MQPLCDRLQEAIARDVAVRVVNELESVEVDEQHRVTRRPRARRLSNGALNVLAEQRAVRQVGQGIVLSGLRKRVTNATLLADVGL